MDMPIFPEDTDLGEGGSGGGGGGGGDDVDQDDDDELQLPEVTTFDLDANDDTVQASSGEQDDGPGGGTLPADMDTQEPEIAEESETTSK
jgi:hypothetical protein